MKIAHLRKNKMAVKSKVKIYRHLVSAKLNEEIR